MPEMASFDALDAGELCPRCGLKATHQTVEQCIDELRDALVDFRRSSKLRRRVQEKRAFPANRNAAVTIDTTTVVARPAASIPRFIAG